MASLIPQPLQHLKMVPLIPWLLHDCSIKSNHYGVRRNDQLRLSLLLILNFNLVYAHTLLGRRLEYILEGGKRLGEVLGEGRSDNLKIGERECLDELFTAGRCGGENNAGLTESAEDRQVEGWPWWWWTGTRAGLVRRRWRSGYRALDQRTSGGRIRSVRREWPEHGGEERGDDVLVRSSRTSEA